LPLSFRQQLLDSAKRPNGNQVFSGAIMSDNYLQFVVKELKPYIDIAFSTRKGKAHTMMMGSSMGGLISIYAICEYPETFGMAGCMSTHWPLIFFDEHKYFSTAMNAYLEQHLPNPNDHKIYFDLGDQTLDSMYAPYQEKVDAIMIKAGYDNSKNWITKNFLGDDHSEKSWRRRLHIPLLFLFNRK
jgi:predicted alpha/beta superfamily hydrolase